MKRSKISFLLLIFCILTIISSCAQKKDPVTGKTETINPSAVERAREFADKNPTIIFGGNKNTTSSEFLKNNPLWRASLKSLDFIPLASVDSSSGLIITDWYSENTSDEEIKISIRFLSNELKSKSISIVSHKRVCDVKNKCKISLMSQNFNSELKDIIINSARVMAIDDKKRDKK